MIVIFCFTNSPYITVQYVFGGEGVGVCGWGQYTNNQMQSQYIGGPLELTIS